MPNMPKPSSDSAKAREEKHKADKELDAAIEDSMIASDPPAPVSKGEPTAPPRENSSPPREKRPDPKHGA
jgi:hypothetical protein